MELLQCKVAKANSDRYYTVVNKSYIIHRLGEIGDLKNKKSTTFCNNYITANQLEN